ncbi:kinase-like domain-containing protein [Trichoderma velutinum]
MPGETSEAQSASQTGCVNFAVFSAANEAALHVLEIIKHELSPPTLKQHGKTIGFYLSRQLSDKCESADFWRIGAGTPGHIIKKNLGHPEPPEILLCPPESFQTSAERVREYIKDVHAGIYLHPKSGVPILKTVSQKSIKYEHGDINDEDLSLWAQGQQGQTTCVMRRSRNFLNFGPYRFVLEFIVQDQDEIEVRHSGYSGLHSSLSLDPTPFAYSKTSWNIWLHNKIPNTSIIAGVNIYTGEPVAVKQMRNRTAKLPFTRNRLQLALQYHKRQGKGVLGIVDVWCEHKISPPCCFDSESVEKTDGKKCKRTFYSMPLAKHNFRDLPWRKFDFQERLALFYETLSGLVELHQCGIIHGNILPESLLILTELESTTKGQSPPTRAFIPLKIHKRKEKPDASVYVAPEVWESAKDSELDETKLDIWAIASSWLCAFVLLPTNLKIKQQSYRVLQLTLDDQYRKGRIKEPLYKLLCRMLAWEPQDRPSAADALADEAWKPIRDKIQQDEISRKRRRAKIMEGCDSDAKKVRLLSPDPDK